MVLFLFIGVSIARLCFAVEVQLLVNQSRLSQAGCVFEKILLTGMVICGIIGKGWRKRGDKLHPAECIRRKYPLLAAIWRYAAYG